MKSFEQEQAELLDFQRPKKVKKHTIEETIEEVLADYDYAELKPFKVPYISDEELELLNHKKLKREEAFELFNLEKDLKDIDLVYRYGTEPCMPFILAARGKYVNFSVPALTIGKIRLKAIIRKIARQRH